MIDSRDVAISGLLCSRGFGQQALGRDSAAMADCRNLDRLFASQAQGYANCGGINAFSINAAIEANAACRESEIARVGLGLSESRKTISFIQEMQTAVNEHLKDWDE